MQPLKKDKDKDKTSLDYSFLFSKLEQLSLENSLYRKAFTQINDVANKIAKGDLSARITHLVEFDKLIPTLAAINKAYDFADDYIHQSETSQIIALKEQDEFKKEQLRTMKDYFEKEIVPALRRGI